MALNTNDPINILDTSNALGLGTGGSMTLNGGISIGKDLYVGGNISISGTATTFSDNILIINNNNNSSSDTGLLFQRHSTDISNNQNYSGIIYSETLDQFIFGYLSNDVNKSNTTFGNYISITADSLMLKNSSNASGLGSGGSLTVNGGVSISKDVIIGGNIDFTGNLYQNGYAYTASSVWGVNSPDIYFTSGNVGIGTTAPTYALHVNGPIYSSDKIISFSDMRFKEQIKTLENSLDKIKKCRGVSFIKSDTGEKHIGFIAQELEEIYPELVSTDDFSGFKSVAYGNTVAILVECIKELEKKINYLESKIVNV